MAKGVRYLEQYRKDFEPLSPKRAILAFCADCMGNYEDKVYDCENKNCPLYPHMPYSSKKGRSLDESDNDSD